MAKGRDHEIVRAIETDPNEVPWIDMEFCVVTAFKCSVKTYATGLSTESYFIYHPIHVGPSAQ